MRFTNSANSQAETSSCDVENVRPKSAALHGSRSAQKGKGLRLSTSALNIAQGNLEFTDIHKDSPQIDGKTKEHVLKENTVDGDVVELSTSQPENEPPSQTTDPPFFNPQKYDLEQDRVHLLQKVERLTKKLSLFSCRDSGSCQEIARLDSENRSLRKKILEVSEEAKTSHNINRRKEKELEKAEKQAEKLAEAQMAIKALKNELRQSQKQEATTTALNRKLQQDFRKRNNRVIQLESRLLEAEARTEEKENSLSGVTANLKMQVRKNEELTMEFNLLRDQLTRTEVVASRVAASEIKAGSKHEGTIPITQHLEEVKYLQGEIQRLKQKLI